MGRRYIALPDAKIRQIQQMMLQNHHYLGRVDGDYQDQTKKAVMWYQQELQKKGLYKGKIDGLWGDQTEAAYQRDLHQGNFPKINLRTYAQPAQPLPKSGNMPWVQNGTRYVTKTTPKGKPQPKPQTRPQPKPQAQPAPTQHPNVNIPTGNVLQYAPQPQQQGYMPWPQGDRYVMKQVPPKYPNHPLAKKLVRPGCATGTEDCARYRNVKLRNYGINLWGDAWQEGGTPVFNGFQHSGVAKPRAYNERAVQNYNEAASEAVKQFDATTLDPSKVYTVNMYFRGSRAQPRAFKYGENGMTGTHTGILIYKDGDWYVNHNIHGIDYEEPFSTLQGKNTGKRYGVTAISDPSQVASQKNGGRLNLNRPYVRYFKEI